MSLSATGWRSIMMSFWTAFFTNLKCVELSSVLYTQDLYSTANGFSTNFENLDEFSQTNMQTH